jgi:hypothetical protein
MPDAGDQKETVEGWRPEAWHGRLIAGLLLVGAALHAFKPSWITLDWQTIVMILVGIFLIFVPLNDLGAVIESLEIGKTKILFRKVKQLDQSVERAVNSRIGAAASVGPVDAVAEYTEEPAQPEPPTANRAPRSDWGDFFEDQRNRTLFDTDPDMMLVRLGIEIERALAQLAPELIQGSARPMVWSYAVRKLEQSNVITPQIARALIEFRDVRNRLIHPTGGSVTAAMVASAVDSGIKLLRLLKGLRDVGRRTES